MAGWSNEQQFAHCFACAQRESIEESTERIQALDVKHDPIIADDFRNTTREAIKSPVDASTWIQVVDF